MGQTHPDREHQGDPGTKMQLLRGRRREDIKGIELNKDRSLDAHKVREGKSGESS